MGTADSRRGARQTSEPSSPGSIRSRRMAAGRSRRVARATQIVADRLHRHALVIRCHVLGASGRRTIRGLDTMPMVEGG